MADIPPAVRVWPLSEEMMKVERCFSTAEVQNNFFLKILPSRDGEFRYPSSGLKADKGTIVLFQYDKQIVALAELYKIEKYDHPKDGYKGGLIFVKDSIKTFKPISEEVLQKTFHFTKDLNRAKYDLPAEHYFDFENSLKNVKSIIPLFSGIEPIDLIAPPDRIESSVYRILRDTELARKVKIKHNFECQICGHKIQLPDGGFYAEAHHLKPLGGKHSGPDIESNIICVCPNHHAELDYGVRRILLSELRHVDGHSINEFFIDYHNSEVYKKH